MDLITIGVFEHVLHIGELQCLDGRAVDLREMIARADVLLQKQTSEGQLPGEVFSVRT